MLDVVKMFCVCSVATRTEDILPGELPQQTQNICITFIQRRTNVGPTLYKCYANVVFAGAVQSQKALTAYYPSKQLRPFILAQQIRIVTTSLWFSHYPGTGLYHRL